MDTNGLLTVLLPVVAGALIGFVPNLLLEGRKDRAARLNRWSDAPYVASVEEVPSGPVALRPNPAAVSSDVQL